MSDNIPIINKTVYFLCNNGKQKNLLLIVIISYTIIENWRKRIFQTSRKNYVDKSSQERCTQLLSTLFSQWQIHCICLKNHHSFQSIIPTRNWNQIAARNQKQFFFQSTCSDMWNIDVFLVHWKWSIGTKIVQVKYQTIVTPKTKHKWRTPKIPERNKMKTRNCLLNYEKFQHLGRYKGLTETKTRIIIINNKTNLLNIYKRLLVCLNRYLLFAATMKWWSHINSND